MTRTVTVVLADGDGTPLGSLPPFDVAMPYWIEMSDVVGEVARRHGLTVDVLRLIEHERPSPPGGAVTYLAQVREPVVDPSAPAPGTSAHRAPLPELAPPTAAQLAAAATTHPLRAPYAEPGGPAASLAWAREALGAPRLDAVQQRTWNVAAHWRLTDRGQVTWLKQVPPYQETELAVLRWFGEHAPHLGPRTLATGEHGRQLLGFVDGVHHYDGGLAELQTVAAAQHGLHLISAEAADDLLALGVPDHRGARMVDWIRGHLEQHVGDHPAGELLERLPGTFDEIDACGLPAALSHGDNNPGNALLDGERVVFLDWGEGFLGHPAFDVLGLISGAPEADRAAVLEAWAARWRRDVPGCDPERAVALVRQVAQLQAAAVYAWLLANIEPSEHVYHWADVPDRLDRAAAVAGVG
ncbi:aminoglycoside phosphotransferase family protein [Actinotalea sp. M2MS4P-6]|uniref:aminoglycoside phosphotransferase family protein n=1 Tax=Actinotalea sp. M2MS4P-6 TaxID=2983762 RepID=UPI0021E3C355|nr:aminoglycoside phosphotransferase family protein [Actinotalea sp. M2MS4P-6]MCV2392697.1 aminoglycoside phosphotransferase family protein [Actinotalea sp. M2MS4P-6]